MKKRFVNRQLAKAGFLVLAFAISVLALHPLAPSIYLPLFPSGSSLVLHAFAFAVLMGTGGVIWKPVWKTALVIGAFAIVLELFQAFSPGRNVALEDGLANLFGVVLGALAAVLVQRLAGNRDRSAIPSSRPRDEP